MVVGIGTDILLIDRISRAPLRWTDAFMRKTYTEKERKQAMERENPTLYFASRFSGKEAVFKTLGADGNAIKCLSEIEILGNAFGAPIVTLRGDAKKIAQQKGIGEILISLSHDTDYVVAYAIANASKE